MREQGRGRHTRENRLTIVTVNQEGEASERARERATEEGQEGEGGTQLHAHLERGKRLFVCSVGWGKLASSALNRRVKMGQSMIEQTIVPLQ